MLGFNTKGVRISAKMKTSATENTTEIAVDIAPELVQSLFGLFGDGLGEMGTKIFNIIRNLENDEPFTADKISEIIDFLNLDKTGKSEVRVATVDDMKKAVELLFEKSELGGSLDVEFVRRGVEIHLKAFVDAFVFEDVLENMGFDSQTIDGNKYYKMKFK